MTAHELAQRLLAGPDLPVHMSYQYGDYWNTQVAPEITNAEDGVVSHSTYHNMDKVVEQDKESEGDRQVILLS